MRTIIIKRFKTDSDIDDSKHIYLYCEFPELDRYIATARRMRPDRIIVEYEEFTRKGV